MSESCCNIVFILSAFVFVAGIVRICQANDIFEMSRNWMRNQEYEHRLHRLYGQ